MTVVLRYGLDSSLALEPRDGALAGEAGSPNVPAVDDLRAEARRALAEPLDYPPLSAIVTPGDRVVLALDHEAVGWPEIVSSVVGCLVDNRVDPEAITILRPVGSAGDDPCRSLPNELRVQVVSLCHALDQRENLAYLATTEEGHAVFLNRAIVDADLLLPIGRFRGQPTAGYYGIHTLLYPTFSDEATLRRFRSAATRELATRRRRLSTREVDEVGWLLGAMMTIQALSAGGDRVLELLAGKVEAVRRRAAEHYAAWWHRRMARPASLVVAAIEGGASQQTWENLGRAMETATPLVEEGGALVLCTELSASPGPAVKRLKNARSRRRAVHRIHDDVAEDAVAAVQLARALDHCSVYLMSRLDDALVEDMEMTPVADPAELARLVGRFDSLIVLGNASYAAATIEDDRP
jgi:nickel-dependent lactate racemase